MQLDQRRYAALLFLSGQHSCVRATILKENDRTCWVVLLRHLSTEFLVLYGASFCTDMWASVATWDGIPSLSKGESVLDADFAHVSHRGQFYVSCSVKPRPRDWYLSLQSSQLAVDEEVVRSVNNCDAFFSLSVSVKGFCGELEPVEYLEMRLFADLDHLQKWCADPNRRQVWSDNIRQVISY
jgi:hypothetical protein